MTNLLTWFAIVDKSSLVKYHVSMKSTQKKLTFIALFVIVGLISLQIPFTKLAGSNVSFTLFDFFGPIAGAFLGPLLGVVSVAAMEFINVLIGHQTLNTIGVIRLLPMLFAAGYFGLLSKKTAKPSVLAIPLLAIALFIANPIGRQVWYYSLFWLIPVAAYFKRNNLLIRSLGTTFVAHAVGGAAWVWVFHLPAAFWKGLIPTVIEERILMTLGIAVSYLAMKKILHVLVTKKIISSLDSPTPVVEGKR